jgi:2-polyprenyl-3-methyl-5-hydroxy-6-metoxy-1,4-benzoquinol methylase
MDDPSIDPSLLAWALRDLDRLNRWGRTAAGLAGAVCRIVDAAESTPAACTVLDVGCGGGGLTRSLATRLTAARPSVAWRVVGIDPSAPSIAAATEAAAAAWDERVEFRVASGHGQSLADAAGGPVDLVVSSLVLHHLPPGELRQLLAACAAEARIGVVMDDLRRDRRAMALTRLAVRTLSRCPVVHVDGPRSVRAALTPEELRVLAVDAGLTGGRVIGGGPARMRLLWTRGGGPPHGAPA